MRPDPVVQLAEGANLLFVAIRRSLMEDPIESVRVAYEEAWGTPSRTAQFRKSRWLIEVEKWAPEANPEA